MRSLFEWPDAGWDARGLIDGCPRRSRLNGDCPYPALASDRGYLFWPATGYWRRPDGSHGGGGKPIEEMRSASSGPAVASDSML